jgi:glucose/arabinose dehydrogenase
LTTTLFVRGLSSPLDFQVPVGERTRAFVVEQGGRIRIARGGALVGTPFLDVSSKISTGGERGLLGLAFHPQYASNGRFYVNYTDRAGDTHISEFRASPPSADAVDPATERELLFVRQPFANHNGGGLAFGNDGFLYASLGDGGSGGDPQGNGQNLSTPLGKLLRMDVDRGSPFAVPSDNPFVARAGAFPAIWAYGLRNPWRFAFDRETGDLYIADVGQNAVEEVDFAAVPRRGGENYGWNTMEGSRCFAPRQRMPDHRPHVARPRIHALRGLLDHGRRRLPGLPPPGLRGVVFLRGLLHRVHPVLPDAGRPGHGPARLDGGIGPRHQRRDRVRTGRRGRGVHRRPGRRGLQGRARLLSR